MERKMENIEVPGMYLFESMLNKCGIKNTRKNHLTIEVNGGKVFYNDAQKSIVFEGKNPAVKLLLEFWLSF